MDEPIQGADTAPACRCYYCGTGHKTAIRYCAECKRYQPDPPKSTTSTVKPCEFCHELIPREAVKCNFCSGFQSGPGRWLPFSTGTLSTLSTLLALVLLLINTHWLPDRSQTSLALVGYGPTNLLLRASNDGSKPSFLGPGWLTLVKDSDCLEACPEPGAKPDTGTMRLKATPPENAVIDPGHKPVSFEPVGQFDPQLDPPPVTCEDLRDHIGSIRMCLTFEVTEYQESKRRCVPLEVSDLGDFHYLELVWNVMGGKKC
jgi:hypothetical protein